MEYFVYGRDRAGGDELKGRLTEEHWAYMDGYGEQLIARGPTLTADREESTGSLHIVDLPDLEAAQRFAFEEPYYRAGAFEEVLFYGFRNLSRRTMWEFTEAVDTYSRFLVITMGETEPVTSKHLIVYGDLLSLDGTGRLGRAATVEAPNQEAAAALLSSDLTEVHPWEFGGRR